MFLIFVNRMTTERRFGAVGKNICLGGFERPPFQGSRELVDLNKRTELYIEAAGTTYQNDKARSSLLSLSMCFGVKMLLLEHLVFSHFYLRQNFRRLT